MRPSLLSLGLLALLSVSALAESTPHWLQLHSPHFTVITDSSQRDLRHVAGQLERMQAVFSKLVPAAHADTGAPIIVLALKDKADFQSLEPTAYLAKNQLDLAGLFLHAQDRSYILLRLDANGDHPYATLYHEYTHYITRHANFPLWLNEGLAEFYQNTDIGEHQVRYGQPSADDLLFLRQHQLLPLPALLAVDRGSPYYHEEDKGSIFYAESWALTHFIIVSDGLNHTDHLADYVRNLAAHQDAVTAFRNAFGDLKSFQSRFDNYIDHGDYKLFVMPMTFAVDEAAFSVDPLATPDADAIRADVLLDNDRTADAEALLDAVLRANPSNALAHESMGALCFRRHDLAGARKWYGEAVALHSTSYLAWYYYAVLSHQRGLAAGPDLDAQAETQIEASLEQSLKLNPSFAPANDALAVLYASQHKNLDDALRLSITAIVLDPTNLNFRLNNAQVHMARQEIPSALAVLVAARSVATTTAQLVAIDQRSEQIRNYQQQLERAQQQAALTRAALSTTGDTLTTAAPTPSGYPPGPPIGPHHTVRGVLHNVVCSVSTVLALTVDSSGKHIPLYSNDRYKVVYRAANFTPPGALEPCKQLEGMNAIVVYTDVSDPRVTGQIVAIALIK
ncbi:MAG TPA: DUF1570 domain-containing protein [Acidobacteriaceae bacterium]|jgi:tetratricopeptide (TPR) repeat protein|nr:DUF1570 domain-containing protein [Acidobacteriaceae bacterium]